MAFEGIQLANVRGFTLLEVMVAFAIAALALTVLTQAASHGTLATSASVHMQEAISRAQSRLAAATLAPHPGEQSGDDGGGFTWRTDVQTVATGALRDHEAVRSTLYHISVEIFWRLDGGQRQVRLDTMRLAPAASRS